MKRWRILAGCACLFAVCAGVRGDDEVFDRLDQALTFTGWNDAVRVHVSGTAELEGYRLDSPALELLYADGHYLLAPRATLFVDGQFGPHWYGFAQIRADRGFDPSNSGMAVRVDEYALRYSADAAGTLNIQVGKFATVVGNWAPRHLSWTNPFVTAPLPYANLTGIWDAFPAPSATTLVRWGHVSPEADGSTFNADKHLRLPVLWGPVYASGMAISGRFGSIDYAVEAKNANLSSHPEYWENEAAQWHHPTFAGRLGYQLGDAWRFGVSADTGPYLSLDALPFLPPGTRFGDYRQTVLGQDLSYAWHHFEFWAEAFEARYSNPRFGSADTVVYYLEAKWKATTRSYLALRWNQQMFGDLELGDGNRLPWGRDAWRIDAAVGLRLTAHAQLKIQYSVQHQFEEGHSYHPMLASQMTLRF